MKRQLPEPSAVVLPSEFPSEKSSTVASATAVPVKVGVESLVRLSVFELPESEAGVRSGVDGAAGGVSSRSLMARATACSDVLPAVSVATTVKA